MAPHRFPRALLALLLPLVALIMSTPGLAARAPAAVAPAAAAGGAAAVPAGGVKVYLPIVRATYAFGQRTVNPIKASVTLDTANRVSQAVPTTGGTLTKTVNGTTYTLSIPKDALLFETTISMTPISRASPMGHSTFVAGVQLQPDDLVLYKSLTLTITPPTAIPVDRQMSWASQDDGTDLHGYPLSLTTRDLVFDVVHFTDYYVSEVDAIPVVDPGQTPATSESQLEQEAQQLVQDERARVLAGLPGDPDFGPKLVELMKEYYDVVIGPKLGLAGQDCNEAQYIIPKALAWEHMTAILGASETFADQDNAITAAHLAALDHCWSVATRPCMNWNDKAQSQQVLGLAREAQILGLDAAHYDPFSLPHCQCSQLSQVKRGWHATLDVSWSGAVTTSSYGTTTQARASRAAHATFDFTTPQVNNWIGTSVGGTASLDERVDTYSPGGHGWETQTGAGAPSPRTVAPQSQATWVGFAPAQCTFALFLPVALPVTSEGGDSAGGHTGPYTDTPLILQLILHNASVAWLPGQTDFTIRRSDVMSPNRGDCTYGNCLTMGYQEASAKIVEVQGVQGLGKVTVNWTLTPLDPPSSP